MRGRRAWRGTRATDAAASRRPLAAAGGGATTAAWSSSVGSCALSSRPPQLERRCDVGSRTTRHRGVGAPRRRRAPARCATTSPSTSTTDSGRSCRAVSRSSDSTTTWAMPLRSRSSRNVNLRELPLMVQPARRCERVRRPGAELRGQIRSILTSIRTIPDVRARGSSRCHRTSPPTSSAASFTSPAAPEGVTPRRRRDANSRGADAGCPVDSVRAGRRLFTATLLHGHPAALTRALRVVTDKVRGRAHVQEDRGGDGRIRRRRRKQCGSRPIRRALKHGAPLGVRVQKVPLRKLQKRARVHAGGVRLGVYDRSEVDATLARAVKVAERRRTCVLARRRKRSRCRPS